MAKLNDFLKAYIYDTLLFRTCRYDAFTLFWRQLGNLKAFTLFCRKLANVAIYAFFCVKFLFPKMWQRNFFLTNIMSEGSKGNVHLKTL